MADEIDYASIIADPNIIDPEYDISRIRTTTPTSERLLAAVPEYSGLRFDPTKQSVYSDLYSLYSGGLDSYLANVDPSTGTVDTSVGTGGGGTGGGNLLNQLETDAGIDAPINVDTPLTQMVTDPVTGQTQTVRQAMTSNDAYRGVDTTMPSMLSSDMGASMVTSPSDTTVLGGDPNINRIDDYLDMNLLDETQPSAMPQGSPGQLNP